MSTTGLHRPQPGEWSARRIPFSPLSLQMTLNQLRSLQTPLSRLLTRLTAHSYHAAQMQKVAMSPAETQHSASLSFRHAKPVPATRASELDICPATPLQDTKLSFAMAQ